MGNIMSRNLFDLHSNPEQLHGYPKILVRIPEIALRLAYKKKDKAFREILEVAIAKTPHTAYEYASKVIKGRFPAGESMIAKDSLLAYQYAVDVINDKFPAGEEAINKNPFLKWMYSKQRFNKAKK